MIDETEDNTEESEELSSPLCLSKLLPRQQLFVLAYCKHGNASRAAREAGYTSRPNTAGYRMLSNVVISTAIDQLMSQISMSSIESLGKLTAWGRGTIDHFMTDTGELDLTTDEAIANRGLIKKFKQKKTVRRRDDEEVEEIQTELELHDAKDAVFKLLQANGKIVERRELSGPNGGPINTNNSRTWTLLDHTGGKPVPAPDEAY